MIKSLKVLLPTALVALFSAMPAQASENNPLLGKQVSAIALQDAEMKSVEGSGTYADTYGGYANNSFYNAYIYSLYGNSAYTADSATQFYYYTMAASEAGLGIYYNAYATYFANYNY